MLEHFFCNYKYLRPDQHSLLLFISDPKFLTRCLIPYEHKLHEKKAKTIFEVIFTWPYRHAAIF